MQTHGSEDPIGPTASDALMQAIRDNLSPEAVAAMIAFLSVARSHTPANASARQALQQVGWFADQMLDLVGVDTYNRLLDELGL